MRFFKRLLTRNHCECGNKKTCSGQYGFLVLYDIEGLWPVGCRVSLNKDKAMRCDKFLRGGL